MQALIDSEKSGFFKCLVENGDLLNVHKSSFNTDVQVGDIIKISFKKDEEATAQQKGILKNQTK